MPYIFTQKIAKAPEIKGFALYQNHSSYLALVAIIDAIAILQFTKTCRPVFMGP
jgi:hypothetical protein